MFITALFTIVRTQKQPKSPSIEEWITHMWCIYNEICSSVQFSSVAQSCPTLCDPMNRSSPGLPVHHHLPEFTQTHVHQVHDAIRPSHPLLSPSPPAPNPSQHQSLFQWVNSSHEVLSHKKEQSWIISTVVDGPRVCHTEWGKSERRKQVSYINTYMWN